MLDVVVEGLPILLRFGLEKFGTIRCVVGHITVSGRLGGRAWRQMGYREANCRGRLVKWL